MTEAYSELDGLSQILMGATTSTARDLTAGGNFTEARAEGTNLLARAGKHTFRVTNRATKGPPGNREKMLNLYASMVVRNLLNRVDAKGEGDG